MNILSRKLFRDLFRNKSQFLSIFIMVFLGVFCFSGIHAYMDGMSYSGKEYYARQNLQDLWAYGNGFSRNDLHRIKQIHNVNDAERKLTINTTLNGFHNVTLETNFLESNRISKFHVVSGEPFSRHGGGVWLDSYLAKNLNLHVGDTLSMKYKGIFIRQTIRGLIMVPDHVYSIKDDTAIFPNHKDWGFVYLSIDQFPNQVIYNTLKKQIAKKMPGITASDLSNAQVRSAIPHFRLSDYRKFTTMMIDVKDRSKLIQTKKDIRIRTPHAQSVIGRSNHLSYANYQSEINEGKTYSMVFSALFLFIAVLSVVTTMNRFVRRERTQIGTLKALGVRRNRIMRHYLSYGFWISLLAALLGIWLGRIIMGQGFLNLQLSFYEVPNGHTVLIPAVWIMAAATILGITLVTWLSTTRILREKAADAIRVEAPRGQKHASRLTTTGLFSKRSLSTKWNLRDIARNKGRTIMALVGIVGCTMLVVGGLGMRDTMQNYMKWEFSTLCHFKYKISLDSDIRSKELHDLKKTYGSATTENNNIEVRRHGVQRTDALTVTDAGNKVRFTDENKHIMKLSHGGIYVTAKYAEVHHVRKGDIITWRIVGKKKWQHSRVMGYNRDPQNQGWTMTRPSFISCGYSYRPDSLYTNAELSENETLAGAKKITSIDSLRKGMSNMTEIMNSMIIVLILVAAILACVIIYNLGILSFTEKQTQFATLRVLGFKNKQIEKIYIRQNLWITIAALIPGIPLGYWLVEYIFTHAIGNEYDMAASVNPSSYVIGALFTLLVSFLVNLILARKIPSIDMVTSLKGNE